jgi:hypothetical protein
MDAEKIGLALFGAVVGATGWLVVGMYLQRRDAGWRARSGARAVWFELGINRVAVDLALDHRVFTPLSRATFERLLPDLAMWLPFEDLEVVARAYQGHAGYEQAWREADLPDAVRDGVLSALATAHAEAHNRIGRRAFGEREQRRREEAAHKRSRADV